MLCRVFFLISLLMSVPPAIAQDSIVEKVIPQLSNLSRSETLRGIKYAENAVADDLEETTRGTTPLKFSEKEKEEHVTAFFKRAHFCYQALTLLFEKKDFPKIAAIYRTRAGLYDDFLQGKIKISQFEKHERENEAAKLRALAAELATLEKNGPPKEGTIRSLEKMGHVLGQVILAAASKELGDVPEVHAFNQGMMALQRDDYANGARHLRPLAERGDPRSQFWVGYMHHEGKGLPQNFSEALKWLQRAADQQETSGQYFLGSMHVAGKGVPRDLVSAYMWFTLAASQGDDTAAKARDKIAPQMTPAQIADAKKRASEWKPAAATGQMAGARTATAPEVTPPVALTGYGQVSRSDGLKAFYVGSTYPSKSECERITKIFADNWLASAKTNGYGAKLESSACETSVPPGTEYESLRDGTDAKHYIFFTHNFRVMFVHERGTPDYERAMCEQMRDAFDKRGLPAKCDAPKQGKQASLRPDTTDKEVSIGYGRISRSDGLNVFFALGSFPNREQCDRVKKAFIDTVLSLTKGSELTAKIERSACDTSAPSGTYYEALRNGAPVKHYTLFHPDMTVMFMHERGTADEERALCERARDAMKSTAPNAACYQPRLAR